MWASSPAVSQLLRCCGMWPPARVQASCIRAAALLWRRERQHATLEDAHVRRKCSTGGKQDGREDSQHCAPVGSHISGPCFPQTSSLQQGGHQRPNGFTSPQARCYSAHAAKLAQLALEHFASCRGALAGAPRGSRMDRSSRTTDHAAALWLNSMRRHGS